MNDTLQSMPESIEVKPQDGGCWHCSTANNLDDMHFDSEFDTNVHLNCVRAAIEDENPEAEIQSYLFEEQYQGGYATIACQLPLKHPVMKILYANAQS